MNESFTAELEHITYQNEENGYTVARMHRLDSDEIFTAIGYFAGLGEGETMEIRGSWKTHSKFGRQFVVDSFEFREPQTEQAIESYLAAGTVSGVGPATAKAIVQAFGEQTIEVLDREPHRLTEIPGIGSKRAETIASGWRQQRGTRRVLIYLHGFGLGGAVAGRIYREYGESAVDEIERNPYKLVETVRGVGFLTADRIAEKLGIEPDSPIRLRSGIMHAMIEAEDRGHTCLPHDRILGSAVRFLGVEQYLIEPILDDLVGEGAIITQEQGERKFYYSPRCFRAETIVCEAIRIMGAQAVSDELVNITAERIREFERARGVSLSSDQMQAVAQSVKSRMTIITGGPGTGKTTVIASIVELMKSAGMKVILAAPTGRAGKRMSEATGHPASTIHRLLGWNFQEGGFLHNSSRPVEGDVFIIDEVSMVDLPLMASLLEALPRDCHLVLVGDEDQLPSIGPGRVLRDLISSEKIAVVRLREVFRQATNSLIITNAYNVRDGKMPEVRDESQGESDFYFIRQSSPEKVKEMIAVLAVERLKQKFGIDPMTDLQVITPMNKGSCGTRALNELLQGCLNPDGQPLTFGRRDLRRGDRVMQLRNDYEKDVFNGDIGIVDDFDSELRVVLVDFEGRLVQYESEELDDLEAAYAVTVHKSQGSEYPAVIVPLLAEHSVMLQRNLLYTALTRGKQVVILIGELEAVRRAVTSRKLQSRYSRLGERLAAYS